jgi:hypothetical protein
VIGLDPSSQLWTGFGFHPLAVGPFLPCRDLPHGRLRGNGRRDRGETLTDRQPISRAAPAKKKRKMKQAA